MNTILEQDIELFAQQFALKDELRKKTIAITGATGLLGACMVRCLLKLNSQQNLGLRVLAVVRNIAKAEAMFGKQNDVLDFYAYDFSKMRFSILPKRLILLCILQVRQLQNTL